MNGTGIRDTGFDNTGFDKNGRGRLLLALLASAALHLSLMFGVAVRAPARGAVLEPILARIDGAGSQPSEMSAQHPSPRHPASPTRAVGERTGADSAAVATEFPGEAQSPQSQRGNTASAADPPPQAQTPASRPRDPPPADDPLPPVEMPLLADPTWYQAAQLDVFPVAREPVRPAYPEGEAAASGGEVTLLLLVDETGRVHECSVVDARPAGVFDDAALAAFRAARFVPGRRDGREVRSRVLVKVAFRPTRDDAAAR